MYLNRCFQTGETPIAGPLIAEDGAFNNRNEDDEDGRGDGATAGATHYEPPPNPKPRSTPQDIYPPETPAAASSTGKWIQIGYRYTSFDGCL